MHNDLPHRACSRTGMGRLDVIKLMSMIIYKMHREYRCEYDYSNDERSPVSVRLLYNYYHVILRLDTPFNIELDFLYLNIICIFTFR